MAHILIVDDDDQVSELIKEVLDLAGHTNERAAAAYGAVMRALDVPFDLVLMDLLLHGSNGGIAALALRGLGYAGPILAITGDFMPINQNLYDRARFSAKLLKPFKMEELMFEVNKLLGSEAAGERRGG